MDENASSRPSKRRRVVADAKDQSRSKNPPAQPASHSSLREKKTIGGNSARKENGVEGVATTNSSTQRRSARNGNANDAAASTQNGGSGTAASAPVRSSGRLRNRTEKARLAPAVNRSSSPRSNKRDLASPSKTPVGPQKLQATRSKTTKSKPGRPRRGEQEKQIWDVPTDDDGSDDNTSEGLLDKAVGGSPDVVNEDEDQGDTETVNAATQLQQELYENGDSAIGQEQLPHYAEKFKELCEDTGYGSTIDALGRFVLEKLCGKRRIPLKGLDSEYESVYHLLEQTVTAGEGNSMLLLGARGCGKTAVVETAISALTESHREDFHLVRLNGFLHTDDKVAVREIWRQLGREAGTEDELNKVSSYADTMATLLALLSHPEELFGPSEDPNAMRTTKSVIIILDEFDLFSYHPRQTLLYNLFDIAQAKKAPLAVLGLTTKVDVTENLEKRVKSRFSHRSVFLPRPRSFAEFSEICLGALRIEDSELEQSDLSSVRNNGEEMTATLKTEQGRAILRGWNTYLQGLWDEQGLQNILQEIFHRTRCPKDFFTCAMAPLSTLALSAKSSAIRVPTAESFVSNALFCPDPAPLPFPIPSNTSSSTTSLPLSLLLTATRLTALHDPGLNANRAQTTSSAHHLTLSFAAVYAEYVRLLTSAKASASASGAAATPGRIWGKDVARESWEKLVDWGLVVPVGTGNGTADARTFRIEISFEEVVDGMGEGGAGALGRWWRDT